MSDQKLTSDDLSRMQEAMGLIRENIHSLAKRVTKESIIFDWEDSGEKDDVLFARIWDEFLKGVWARSLDTVSRDVSLVIFSLGKGTEIPRHRHPRQAETIFVAEGRVDVWNADQKFELESNGTVLIQKNVSHSIKVYEDSTLISRFVPRILVEIETIDEMGNMTNYPPSVQRGK